MSLHVASVLQSLLSSFQRPRTPSCLSSHPQGRLCSGWAGASRLCAQGLRICSSHWLVCFQPSTACLTPSNAFSNTLHSEVTLLREVFPTISTVNFRAAHSTQRLTFTWVYPLIIKEDIKDTDEQADEEVHRHGLEGSQAQKLLSLWNWGAPPPRHVGPFTNMEARQLFLRILICSACPCPLPLLRGWCGAESSQTLISWSFWYREDPAVSSPA